MIIATHAIDTLFPECDRTSPPDWARGATAVEIDGYGYECYRLERAGRTVGWLYDDGSGYRFFEGGTHDGPEPYDA